MYRPIVLLAGVGWFLSDGIAQAPIAIAPGTYRVADIRLIGLEPELEQQVRSRLPVRTGEIITADGLRSLSADLRRLDPGLTLASAQRPGEEAPNERILVIRLAVDQTAIEVPTNPLRMDREAQMKNLALRVVPVYPVAARQDGVRGDVLLDAVIGTDGLVKNVRVLSGDSRLAGGAVEAVRQWVYRPVLSEGRPVAVITEIRISFAFAPPL